MALLLVSKFQRFEPKLDQIEGLNLDQKSVINITTAANVYDNPPWLAEEIAPIKARAKSFQSYDLLGKTPEQTAADIAGADIIYVSGGNTYYLLEQVQKSGFAEAVQSHIAKGGDYYGCSAGAALACPRIDYIEQMDDPSAASLTDFTGLNLINAYLLPHIDHDSYGPQATEIMAKHSPDEPPIIGLRDDQGLYVQNNALLVI